MGNPGHDQIAGGSVVDRDAAFLIHPQSETTG